MSGRIRWQQTQLIPAVIWVSVQAYDALGLPVGVRKLETRPSCTQNGADAPCSFMDVEMVVYSLGPVIQIVEVLAEARP